MEEELIKKIAVTFELCGGTTLSEPATLAITEDLDRYDPKRVSMALDKCRKEVRGRLSAAEIIQRVEHDDGRPGHDEAWAMLPKRESETVCWTHEMASAYGICSDMILSGDLVAARMAFREAYDRRCSEARSIGEPIGWTISLGHERSERADVLREAVKSGRIGSAYAEQLLGYPLETHALPEPVNKKPLTLTDGGHDINADPESAADLLCRYGIMAVEIVDGK